MTIKQLHHIIHKRNGYLKGVSFKDIVSESGTLLVVDVCAVMMHILKKEKYACRLLQAKLCEKSKCRFSDPLEIALHSFG